MSHGAFALTFVALAFTGVNAHAVTHNLRARSSLSNGMQPAVVARTLANVEEEWKAQAALFVECNGTSNDGDSVVNCAEAPNSFAKSCSTVVAAIVQGSNGDRDVAKEYMGDVCAESALNGWLKQGCLKLSVALDGALTADTYENRVNFDGHVLCGRFWSGILEEEQKRAAEEKAEQEEQDRKAAEQAAAAAKKASEEAAAEADRKKKEREAREAKLKAAEAAAQVAQKKAEAVEVAEAAKKAKEEAAAAEKKHQELEAKANVTRSTAQPPAAKNESSTVVTDASEASNVARNSSSQKATTVAAVVNTTAVQSANITK